ncbi:hypothetical protein D1872_201340 [compost metagenome]
MSIFCFVLVLEGKRTTIGDNTQIVLQIFFGHPDPCVGNRQGAVLFIDGQFNEIIVLIEYQPIIGQSLVVYFINRIT